MNNEVSTHAFVKLFNHLQISLFPAGRQDPVPVLAVGPGPGGVRGAAAGAGGEARLLCWVPHHHHHLHHPGAQGEDEAAGGEAEAGQRDHLQTRRGLRIMYLRHEH